MSSFSNVMNASRDEIIERIRSNPQVSLAELGKTVGASPRLKGITIGEIVGAQPAAPAASINTRTPVDRDAYDWTVLQALKAYKQPAAAPDLAAVAGGTALQIRTSLNRLIAADLVTYTGQARGTRYSVLRSR